MLSVEEPWNELDLDADEDPRQLFGLEELSFGTQSGLWVSERRGASWHPAVESGSRHVRLAWAQKHGHRITAEGRELTVAK
ncbi:hypothetical protein ACFW93_47060 [Streptomyces canus]|uniref:hypothetical protein n=1 Tax=Streptomyces canus TaxID=58343 RepID=UPI003694D53C